MKSDYIEKYLLEKQVAYLEVEREKISANIDYMSMMTDVDLNVDEQVESSFNKIKEYYKKHLWNEDMLKNARAKKRITEKEYKEIAAESDGE